MPKWLINQSTLTDIANAIRAKKGTSGAITVSEMADEIASISGGGGEEPLYKVAVFSDEHTTGNTAETDWIAFNNLAKSEYALAIVGCGDISLDGDETELNLWKTLRDSNRGSIPVYTCNGNHESKSTAGYMKFHPELMRQYLDSDADGTSGQKNYFAKEIGKDIYAFIPIFEGASEHKSSTMFSSEVLTWLGNLLETYRNQRVFLFAHIPPDYHYVPDNFGGVQSYQEGTSYEWGYTTDGQGYPRADRTQFLELLAHYKNAIWFSGHTHVSYKEADEEDNINIVHCRYNTDGARLVHVPSVTMPRTIDDGVISGQIYAKSECIIMEVFANKVNLVYHDMITSEKQTFEIDTTPVIIPPITPTKTLSSISATKTKVSYEVGETFSSDDVVVTAHYSDSTTATVTTSATIGTVDTSTTGEKTLEISYTEDGVTKTTTIAITVTAEPVPVTKVSISATKTKTSYTVGETFSNDDVVVTMHYSDGTTSIVPHSESDLSIGTVDTSTAGTKTLLIRYDDDGNTLETTIAITVAEAPSSTWTYTRGTKLDTNTGAESTDNNYGASGFFNFSGSTYTLSINSEAFAAGSYPRIFVLFYDSDKNFIGKTAEARKDDTSPKTGSVPANTVYARIRGNNSYMTDDYIALINMDNIIFS